MPKINFNTKAIKAIKSIGVYDAWVTNMIEQWNVVLKQSSNGKSIKALEQMTRPDEIIRYTLVWKNTPEGHNYWNDVVKKLKELFPAN